MKKIVLFSHKGGVSKTTTIFHIGWKIAELGHKVLLVDADSQCNLSSYFLGDQFDEYYSSEETKNNNIKDGVSVAFESKPIPITALSPAQAARNPNLFLLPGHMNLSEYDATLTMAQQSLGSLPVFKNIPGAFNDLITKTAESIGAEYVLIDLNPSLSATNKNLFLISDGFIIPTNPDSFSSMALKSLTRILPKWMDSKARLVEELRDAAYPFPGGTPKFIGMIAQRFNIRNGRPTSSFMAKIEELSSVVVSELYPALNRKEMVFDEADYKNIAIDSDYKIGEIKDFQTLAPKSHNACVPVYALTDEELDAVGQVFQTASDNRAMFGELYTEIANKIITLLHE